MRPIKSKQGSTDIVIIGDGYSEKIYFDFLKKEEKLRNFKILPELPSGSGKGGNYVKVFKKAEEYSKDGYKKIFCLIDMDTILTENNDAKYAIYKKRLEQKGSLFWN